MGTDTHTRGMPWGDASTSKGTPKIASKPSAAGEEAWSRFSLTASGGTNPADTWVLDFQPPERETVQFCCFSNSVWYFVTH